MYGRIVTIEYELNQNAYIYLIHNGDGEKRYILIEVPIKMVNALPLSVI